MQKISAFCGPDLEDLLEKKWQELSRDFTRWPLNCLEMRFSKGNGHLQIGHGIKARFCWRWYKSSRHICGWRVTMLLDLLDKNTEKPMYNTSSSCRYSHMGPPDQVRVLPSTHKGYSRRRPIAEIRLHRSTDHGASWVLFTASGMSATTSVVLTSICGPLWFHWQRVHGICSVFSWVASHVGN